MPSMKIPRSVRIYPLLLTLLLLAGCAKQVNPATLAPDDLYQRATEAYEARNWGRAIPLLQTFVQQHLGDPRAPQARLMLGRLHMERRDYVTAATHFQQLVTDFPTNPLASEARFAICEAYVRLSPRPQLDQEYTMGALAHCQSIADNFPGTPEAEKAAAYVADLREKLAEKAYQTGVFYRKRGAYDAAIVYFQDVLEQFSRTAVAPAALQALMETYQVLGYVEEAAQARQRLIDEYPDSAEAQGLQG